MRFQGKIALLLFAWVGITSSSFAQILIEAGERSLIAPVIRTKNGFSVVLNTDALSKCVINLKGKSLVLLRPIAIGVYSMKLLFKATAVCRTLDAELLEAKAFSGRDFPEEVGNNFAPILPDHPMQIRDPSLKVD